MANSIIIMNRGDTYRFNLTIKDENGDPYRLTDQDALYFGIMDPHQPFEEALIREKVTKANYVSDEVYSIAFEIEPKDTLNLLPGVYYYSVKLHRVDKASDVDEVITIINKTKLVLND